MPVKIDYSSSLLVVIMLCSYPSNVLTAEENTSKVLNSNNLLKFVLLSNVYFWAVCVLWNIMSCP